MFYLKSWVELTISENVREKTKLLMMEDVDTFMRSAHMINNEYEKIVDYLFEWIDLCCAYSLSCDIVDMYYMSLDGLDDFRLEDAGHLMNQVYPEI